jgi:hypothetical protein
MRDVRKDGNKRPGTKRLKIEYLLLVEMSAIILIYISQAFNQVMRYETYPEKLLGYGFATSIVLLLFGWLLNMMHEEKPSQNSLEEKTKPIILEIGSNKTLEQIEESIDRLDKKQPVLVRRKPADDETPVAAFFRRVEQQLLL